MAQTGKSKSKTAAKTRRQAKTHWPVTQEHPAGEGRRDDGGLGPETERESL